MSFTVTTTNTPIFSTSSAGAYLTISSPKTVYNVLGDDIEVDGYKDYNIANTVALINVLGKPYFDEIKKQGISLPDEIEKVLEEKFRILERDKKINSVIGK